MKFNTLNSNIAYKVVCSNDSLSYTESGYYCFGHYLTRLQADTQYDSDFYIKLHKNETPKNRKHAVYLTQEEMAEYFESISKTYGTKIELVPKSELDDEDSNFNYLVKVHISGNKRKHLWILNMIRLVYEHPFNMFLKEAIRLKAEVPEFKDELLPNIVLTILTSAELTYILRADGRTLYYRDQSPFFAGSKIQPLEIVLQKLEESGLCSDIYGETPVIKNADIDITLRRFLTDYDYRNRFWDATDGVNIAKKLLSESKLGIPFLNKSNLSCDYIEYWLKGGIKEDYEERVTRYINMYNLLKS